MASCRAAAVLALLVAMLLAAVSTEGTPAPEREGLVEAPSKPLGETDAPLCLIQRPHTNWAQAGARARKAAALAALQKHHHRRHGVAALQRSEYPSKYGKEYLLDVDYIYDSSNPLDTTSPKPTTPKPTTTTTTTSVTDKLTTKSTTGDPRTTPTTTTTKKTTSTTNKKTTSTKFTMQCATRQDPRSGLIAVAKQAETGALCVWGADPADEGEHCIHDDGAFGSYGWCYTKQDKSEWGSCTEECPLWGQHKELEERIEGLSDQLSEATAKMADLAKLAAEAAGR